MILDVLRFIEYLYEKLAVLVFRRVTLEQIVGGNQHIKLLIPCDQLRTFLLRADHRAVAHFRCKLLEFRAPVEHERGRTHNERRAAIALLL